MLSSRLRTVGLAAVLAVVIGSQCFGACLAAACAAQEKPASTGCHSSKAPVSNEVDCRYQHPVFAGPEAGAKFAPSVAAWLPAASLPPASAFAAAGLDLAFIAAPDPDFPPGSLTLSRISVLRI